MAKRGYGLMGLQPSRLRAPQLGRYVAATGAMPAIRDASSQPRQ